MSSSTPPEPPRGPFGHRDPVSRGASGGPDDSSPPTPQGRRPVLGFPRLNPLNPLNPLKRPDPVPAKKRSVRSQLLLLGLALLGVLLLLWITTEFLPRWWAFQVGSAVDGRLPSGIVLGLVCGAGFTLLPLYALRYPLRPGVRWSRRLLLLVGVLALALPNMLTLGIEVGADAASMYGRRIFDISAPGFRGASLFGALAAVVGWIFWRTAAAARPGEDGTAGAG